MPPLKEVTTIEEGEFSNPLCGIMKNYDLILKRDRPLFSHATFKYKHDPVKTSDACKWEQSLGKIWFCSLLQFRLLWASCLVTKSLSIVRKGRTVSSVFFVVVNIFMALLENRCLSDLVLLRSSLFVVLPHLLEFSNVLWYRDVGNAQLTLSNKKNFCGFYLFACEEFFFPFYYWFNVLST